MMEENQSENFNNMFFLIGRDGTMMNYSRYIQQFLRIRFFFHRKRKNEVKSSKNGKRCQQQQDVNTVNGKSTGKKGQFDRL